MTLKSVIEKFQIQSIGFIGNEVTSVIINNEILILFDRIGDVTFYNEWSIQNDILTINDNIQFNTNEYITHKEWVLN